MTNDDLLYRHRLLLFSLGHDSVQTTLELYGHVTPRMGSNAAARFGSLLYAARTPSISAHK